MPKGVYDRASSSWKPKPKKDYDPNLIAQVRELYVTQGHTMAEVASVVGVSVKVLQTLMPRHGIERRPAIKRSQRRKDNSSWRGDQAGYQALHLRVQAVRGKPNRCSACDTTDPQVRYEWANMSGDYTEIHDYARLCAPCHRRIDGKRRKATGMRTGMPKGGDNDV